MKTLKTALSLLMVLCLLLSLGAAAFAESEGDQQPAADPAPAAPAQAPADAPVAQAAAPVANASAAPAQEAPAQAPVAKSGTGQADSSAAGIVIEDKGSTISITQNGVDLTPDNIKNTDTISYLYVITDRTSGNAALNAALYVNAWGNTVDGYTNNTPVTVNGDIQSNSPSSSAVTVLSYDYNEMQVTINGNVSSAHMGITANSFRNGEMTVTVNGNVSADYWGIFCPTDSDSNAATISVTGDVSGKNNGIRVSCINNDITVGTAEEGGTVTGGVMLAIPNYDVASVNNSITAWKIDEVSTNSADKDTSDSVIQSVIHYIVRLVQPENNAGSLSATKEDGSTLDEKNGIPVEQEGKTIALKVTAQEGYEVIKAYNGDQIPENELVFDNNTGVFLYPVVRGGGILLNAVFKSTAPPQPQPAPKPAVSMVDLSFASVKCTFDLDGGSLGGETGKVIKWFVPGATVKLPGAPTKDGFTFAGWQTVVNGEKAVFQAGEKFTVTGAQNFTALWD